MALVMCCLMTHVESVFSLNDAKLSLGNTCKVHFLQNAGSSDNKAVVY